MHLDDSSDTGSYDLLNLLKRYFGYDSFRKLQEDVIQANLKGRDGLVLLPTGGGKSLCYQLPALARDGLTIVVTPTISLMKDQVDSLKAAGVPATFLNTTLNASESRRRLAGLHNGEYKLLYIAPEGLPGKIEQLKNCNPQCLAIDEAHCVSEWGHQFRPEYNRLAGVRKCFGQIPIMALTATATERVRADIIEQLDLREPLVAIGSFNRPNLLYRVINRVKPLPQILDIIKKYPNESGIVYCTSRNSTERLAAGLIEKGVDAAPYHAGMESVDRNRTQEAFKNDDVKVICATIAFGMGINKPDVRFVIHRDLPKNIEAYYQETGRAGRDGLPAECVLLFNAADVAKLTGFIEVITEEEERMIARKLLQKIIHYAENSECRRRVLLDYFSETYTEENCGACDNCLEPKETFDGTIVAQKILSCVYRIETQSGFSVGLNHIADVLTGAKTEKIKRWGHDKLSTYGIGDEFGREQWKVIARELVRLGMLKQTPGLMSVIQLTGEGATWLRNSDRQALELTKPTVPKVVASPRKQTSDIECDEALFERLRSLRRQLANKNHTPAYIVFGDVSLRYMAREYPTTLDEFERIPGVGQSKLEEFGEIFIREISSFLEDNPKKQFGR